MITLIVTLSLLGTLDGAEQERIDFEKCQGSPESSISLPDAPLRERKATAATAWAAWENGDVDDAEKMAGKLSEDAEAHHLLFLCALVKGQYEAALEHYSKVDSTYAKLGEIDEPALHALLHLHRYGDAERLARERNLKESIRTMVELREKHPLKVKLKRISVVPFAKHPLADYFPAFNAELEGSRTVVHMDTGGTFLILGPDRAAKLGIEVKEAGTGFHGTKKVKLSLGIAKRLRLGDAVLEHAPVVVMPTLRGSQDFIIFGTNVLQQFHATLDYPRKRLVLSPRGDKDLLREHMKLLPGERVEVPFLMWGDHYMFARGRFGEHRNLNFFIDSGLVDLTSVNGRIRQACFMATPALYTKWGITPEDAEKRHFESSLPIALGALEQKRQFFSTVKNPSWTSFGGVRIDGLLSHAFLNRYAWTIDFDRHRYIFSMK